MLTCDCVMAVHAIGRDDNLEKKETAQRNNSFST